MGLGIGLELGGHLFYVCLSAKRKRLLQGGHLKKSVPCFWPFSPPAPNVQREFFIFIFFRCTKLHDQHSGVVGGGAWDFKLIWNRQKKNMPRTVGWFERVVTE